MEIKDLNKIKKKTVNKFIAIEFVLCWLIVFFTINKISLLASMGFILSFVLLIGYIIFRLTGNKISREHNNLFVLMVLIVIIAFLSILINGVSANLSFEYFKKYLIFCSTIIYLFLISIIKINNKTVEFILYTNIALGLLYSSCYYLFGIRGYLSNRYLTFNFSNPNLVAMWILQTVIYLLLSVLILKNKTIKVICIPIAAILTYFIYLTEARTCLIAITSFLVLMLYVGLKKKLNFGNFFLAIAISFPLIFAIVYMALIDTINVGDLNFLTSEGKNIASRVIVWDFAFDHFKEHPISGAYYQISFGTGQSQMHNTHVDILASYGIVTFLLVSLYLYSIVKKINKQCYNKIQTLCLGAFLTVIIMGMGEAALFSGGQGIYILGCSFLLLARYNFYENKEQEE